MENIHVFQKTELKTTSKQQQRRPNLFLYLREYQFLQPNQGMSTIFAKGFSTAYGRYGSQLTTKKAQEKYSVIFAQNVRKVAHLDTVFKKGFSLLIIELKILINTLK